MKKITRLGTARLLRSARLGRVTFQFDKQSKPPPPRSTYNQNVIILLELCFTQFIELFVCFKTGSLASLELNV